MRLVQCDLFQHGTLFFHGISEIIYSHKMSSLRSIVFEHWEGFTAVSFFHLFISGNSQKGFLFLHQSIGRDGSF